MLQLQNIYITLAWVLCIQLGAWGIGRPLYRLLTGKSEQSLAAGLDTVFSAGLGYIILAYAAFALAALHILYPWIVITCTAACALWGAVQLFHVRPIPRPALSWQDTPLLLGIIFAASYIPNALHPVLFIDDNVYHLLIPRLYLENHGLIYLPSNLFANMPHIVEVLYTIPMAIGDFTAPKVLSLAFSFWTIAALYLFPLPLLGRFGAGLVPLLFLSGKNIQFHFGPAHIEPVMGFFLLCACLSLLKWRETHNPGFLRILALACGFVMASKYTGWFFVVAILGGTVALVLRSAGLAAANKSVQKSGRNKKNKNAQHEPTPFSLRLRLLSQTALIVLALIAPWLIKNFIFTGNPVYPNLYGLFGGAFWSKIHEMHYLRYQAFAGGPNKTFFTYLAIPWRLLIYDTIYFYCPVFSASLMALWLIALIRPSSYRLPQRHLLVMSILGFVLWALSVQQGRFLVAWVPVMAAAATLALTSLRDRMRTLVLIFCGIMVLGVYQIVAQNYPYAPQMESFTSPREKLMQQNDNFELCEFLNRVVPEDGKVLALWEGKLFFLRRTFQADSTENTPAGLTLLREAGDPAIFARELDNSHFTHVVINMSQAFYYFKNDQDLNLLDDRIYPASQLEKDRDLMTRCANEYLEPMHEQAGVVVFRIRSELIPAKDAPAGRR